MRERPKDPNDGLGGVLTFIVFVALGMVLLDFLGGCASQPEAVLPPPEPGWTVVPSRYEPQPSMQQVLERERLRLSARCRSLREEGKPCDAGP